MANILFLAGPKSRYQRPGARPAGFFAGLWHGFNAPLMFFVSLVFPGVRVYEANNKGRRYEFGFLIGIGAFAGASHSHGPFAH